MDRGGPAFGTAMAAAAFAVVLLCPGFAVAGDAIPLEPFGRLPSLETVVISPDGTKIAFVRTRADSRSLVVAPLNKPEVLGGVRIGVIHGRRPRWQEVFSVLHNMLFVDRYSWGGFQRQVVHAFRDVDVIVFGHFHRPYRGWHQGVLVFNPGAIYLWSPENVRVQLPHTRSPIHRLFLKRAALRKQTVPTVGLLTIKAGTVRAEVLPVPLEAGSEA